MRCSWTCPEVQIPNSRILPPARLMTPASFSIARRRDWFPLICLTHSPEHRDYQAREKKAASFTNQTTLAHTHLVSPRAESLDDREVVALVPCKRLPRLVCPGLLTKRPLEGCLVALPYVHGAYEGREGMCVDKPTNYSCSPKPRSERS